MKFVGKQYLLQTLSQPIQRILSYRKENLEIDPLRFTQGHSSSKTITTKQNFTVLDGFLQDILAAIFNSFDKMPREFYEIFCFMKDELKRKFGDSSGDHGVLFSGVSGFIFLRFFCPTIITVYLLFIPY